MNNETIFLYVVLGAICLYILAQILDVFILESRMNKKDKLFEKKYEAEVRANERIKTIDEIISTLAKNDDTILSDKQYYEILKLKGGEESENY